MVVLQQPSPLQQHATADPALRTPSVASCQATSEFVSTTSVSPGASVLRSTVPVAWMKAVPPVPSGDEIVWRMQPKPAQQQVAGLQSTSKDGRPPPTDDRKRPRRARTTSYCAKSRAMMSAGFGGVMPTYVGVLDSFVYAMTAQASPEMHRWQQPSQLTSAVTPGPMYIMLPGSSITVSPGGMPMDRMCICSPTMSQFPFLLFCWPSLASHVKPSFSPRSFPWARPMI
mmetsp:Transcript_22081/g.66275  ORF Transcript_22081/g.66275 Transcript_22081/m.66275 type:complete len:228 (-) Transcript_22081:100-783(-)